MHALPINACTRLFEERDRLIIAAKFRQPVWSALLHAFSQVMLLLIAFNSFRRTIFGKGPEWKGRSYPLAGRTQ